MIDVLESIFGSGILQKYPDEWGVVLPTGRAAKIAAATTLSPSVIQGALDIGANLIVTHHDSWSFMYEHRDHAHEMLRKNGVGHIWCHHPLDIAEFGPAASLLRLLGCELVDKTADDGGRIGDLSVPLELEECIERFSLTLGERPCRVYNSGKTVSRVATAPGAGILTDYLRNARRYDPQLYITGETNLYLMEYAAHIGISVLIYSHNYTELPAVIEFAKRVSDHIGSVPVEIIEEPHY